MCLLCSKLFQSFVDCIEDDPKATHGIDLTARVQGALALRQKGGMGREESRRKGAALDLQGLASGLSK